MTSLMGDFFSRDYYSVLFAVVVVALGILLNYTVRSAQGISDLLRGSKKKHSWKENKEPLQTSRCSICETLLVTVESFYCDMCGVCADVQCLKKANNTVKCKRMFTEVIGPLKHSYIKGNLPVGSECAVCHEECGHDFRCIWCHMTVHINCKKMLAEKCDTGKYKNFIIPPSSVVQTFHRINIGRVSVTHEIREPEWSQNRWTPLFVLISRKSGSKFGGEVISAFRGILNPLQVIVLGEQDPSLLCQWLDLLPESAQPIVLVGSGDGGIAWVLTTLHKLQKKKYPPVGIIPLGTGNDLSRVLNWGSKITTPFSVQEYLEHLQKAKEGYLDRWEVNYKVFKRRGLSLNRPHQYFMYNYLSIGVDALVALNFHETRNNRSYLFGSQLRNKLMYLIFGTQQVLDRECKGLEAFIELYLDDERIDIPELEAIIVLNIQRYGGGVDLWNLSSGCDSNQYPRQAINDEKIEIASAASSFQLAQFQLGLSEPTKLGQAKKVKLVLKKRIPMQIDGEPWMQPPGQIEITFANQARVLLKD
ncbi:diacylglycerol kinase epsilon [Cimex lectularius]|uniref:Diacylglycerol kinase n=1 Tax=Cimex lectularius TaxID=79782 RepID=A0A8I6SBU7_CIMLE|nr:diacylglycerol kinase epsilon [Cimex lectularius]XP_024084158.1 diacylglycerol kinase epsilon [Cimex lectularius]